MKLKSAPEFDALIPNDGAIETQVGGKLALPHEFDNNLLAGHWAKKGADVDAARGNQPVTGTKYSSPGWNVWVYPNELPDGEDSTGQSKTKKHKKAGQPHEVALSDGTYVLMCRPLIVQQQVNEAYALHSRQMMRHELSGTTIAGSSHTDRGMLGEQQLNSVERYSDIENERQEGRAPVLHGATEPSQNALVGNKTKLKK